MSKFELKDIDPEDLMDIILQLEESFGTTFPNDAFKDVATFGDLVAAIENNLIARHSATCTSQQAFYRIRKALKKMNFDLDIKPRLQLNTVFPKKNRRATITEFVSHLRIDIKLLHPNGFLLTANLFILLIGVILLIPFPLIGLITIACSLVTLKLIFKYGAELRVKNIRQLSELLTNEKYSLTRSSLTINKNEIWNIVESYFRPYELGEKLTADSKF